MKRLSSNWPFILLLLISFSACVPRNSKRKIEYNGKLQYFTDRNGYEHSIYGEGEKAFIILPECFRAESWESISLTDQYVYRCDKNDTYITIDAISEEKYNEYASYSEEEEIKDMNKLSILSNYMVSYKSATLVEVEQIKRYYIQTEANKTMRIIVIKGWDDSLNRELFCQFGVIKGDAGYYILQSVIAIDNAPFLSGDVIKIFRSFES